MNPGIPGPQNLLLAILHYHEGSTIHYYHRENNTREETKYLGSKNRQLAQALLPPKILIGLSEKN